MPDDDVNIPTVPLAAAAAVEPAAARDAELREAGWPDALIKAAADPFEYAARVGPLGVVYFSRAEPAGEGWVRLTPIDATGYPAIADAALPCPFPRGVEVRLRDIDWVADAPHGS